MLLNEYYVGVYWTQRRESAAQCGQRLSTMLACLAQIDAFFGQWFETHHIPRESLKRRVAANADLDRLMRDNPLTKLDGYSISLWTGPDDQGHARLLLHCGLGSAATERFICNMCTIDFPNVYSESATGGRIFQVGMLVSIVECLVRSWQPDWAVVVNEGGRSKIATRHARHDAHARSLMRNVRIPQIGWLTYLPCPPSDIPALPADTQIVEVRGMGAIIIATQALFDADNEAHINAIEEIAVRLEHSRLLDPLQYWDLTVRP